MTSATAIEFLTKQLSIEKETVTFRWLSRKLSVHVNVAKNELASFYASCRSTDAPVYATYLLTGDVAPIKATGSYRDKKQEEIDIEDDDQVQVSVSTSKIFLVGEDDVEEKAAKAQFTREPSVHIYSLSPSTIRDGAMLALMADRVRPDDVSKGKAFNETIGIVVGPDVKIGQMTKPVLSKLEKANNSSGSYSKLNPPEAVKKLAERRENSENGKTSEKTKQEEKKKGTLDWSVVKGEKEQGNETTTAKTFKEVVKKEPKLDLKKSEGKAKPGAKNVENTRDVKVKKEPAETNVNTEAVEPDNTKRGIKRPSAVMSLSDSEDDNPSPKTKARTSATSLFPRPPSRTSGVKVKNGVLLSDDDDDDDDEGSKEANSKTAKRNARGRASVAEEKEEEEEEEEVDPSLKAMMDLDDSQVICQNNQLDHQSDKDIEMLSDDEPPRPKPKRKSRKIVPVGKNGLQKRRVVKSRKSKNAKGYTITEDYSSYESVSESGQVQAISDPDKKEKKSRKRSKEEQNSGASKAKGSRKPKEHVDVQSSKTEGGSHTLEEKSETKKPGSGTGGGSTMKSNAKVNSGKTNLMSYFTKK